MPIDAFSELGALSQPTQPAGPSDTFAELGEVLGAMEGVKARRAHVPSFGERVSAHADRATQAVQGGLIDFATSLPVAGEALVNPILGGHPMSPSKYGGAEFEVSIADSAARMRQAATEVSKATKESGVEAGFWNTVIPSGVTSMATMLVPGAAVRGLGGAASSARAASLSSGSLLQGQAMFMEARYLGAPEEVQLAAMLAGFAIGTTEMIPVERVLGAASKMGPKGSLSKRLMQHFKSGAVPEAVQEGLVQTPLEIVVAQHVLEYAPKESAEEIVKKVSEAFAAGGIIGGGASTAFGLANDRYTVTPQGGEAKLVTQGDTGTAQGPSVTVSDPAQAAAGEEILASAAEAKVEDPKEAKTGEQAAETLKKANKVPDAVVRMAGEVTDVDPETEISEGEEALGGLLTLLRQARPDPSTVPDIALVDAGQKLPVDGVFEGGAIAIDANRAADAMRSTLMHEVLHLSAAPGTEAFGEIVARARTEFPGLVKAKIDKYVEKFKEEFGHEPFRDLPEGPQRDAALADEGFAQGAGDFTPLVERMLVDPSLASAMSVNEARTIRDWVVAVLNKIPGLNLETSAGKKRRKLVDDLIDRKLQDKATPEEIIAFADAIRQVMESPSPAEFRKAAEAVTIEDVLHLTEGTKEDTRFPGQGTDELGSMREEKPAKKSEKPFRKEAKAPRKELQALAYVVDGKETSDPADLSSGQLSEAIDSQRRLVDGMLRDQANGETRGHTTPEVFAAVIAVAQANLALLRSEVRSRKKAEGATTSPKTVEPTVAEMPRTAPDMFGETQEKKGTRGEVVEDAGAQGAMFQEDTGARGQTSLLDSQDAYEEPSFLDEILGITDEDRAAFAEKQADELASIVSRLKAMDRNIAELGKKRDDWAGRVYKGNKGKIGKGGHGDDASAWGSDEQGIRVDDINETRRGNRVRGFDSQIDEALEARKSLVSANRRELKEAGREDLLESPHVLAKVREQADQAAKNKAVRDREAMVREAEALAQKNESTFKEEFAKLEGKSRKKSKAEQRADASKVGRQQFSKRKQAIIDNPDSPFIHWLRAIGGVNDVGGDLESYTRKENPGIHKGVFGLPDIVRPAGKGLEADIIVRMMEEDGWIVDEFAEANNPIDTITDFIDRNPQRSDEAALSMEEEAMAAMEEQYEEEVQRLMEIGHPREMAEEIIDERAEAAQTGRESLYGVDGDPLFSIAPREDSAAFKKWFKDSKVVDSNGRPLVVYHGTGEKFTVFDPARAWMGQHWFTTNRSLVEAGEVGASRSGEIMEVYLSIQNPASWEAYEKFGVGELIEQGYDGIGLVDEDQTTYVAFSPTQIKSATGNVGSYGQRPVTESEAKRLGMSVEEANEAQERGDTRFSVEGQGRFEAGRVLTNSEKEEVLSSMGDVYVDSGLEKELVEVERGGETVEVWRYPVSPELWIKSEVTGQKIRFYIKTPDGRIAHPSELFPNVSQGDVVGRGEQMQRDAKVVAANNAQRVSQWMARIATDGNEANKLYRKTNQPMPGSYFASRGDEIVRVNSSRADEVAFYEGEGFARSTPDVPRFSVEGGPVTDEEGDKEIGVDWESKDVLIEGVIDQHWGARKLSAGVEDLEPDRVLYSEFSKAEIAYTGKVAHEMGLVNEALQSEYAKITGDAISLDDSTDFLEALHAPERNQTAIDRDMAEMASKERPYLIVSKEDGKTKRYAGYKTKESRDAALKKLKAEKPDTKWMPKEDREGWGHERKPASGWRTSEAQKLAREKLNGPHGARYRRLRRWFRKSQAEVLEGRLRDGAISQEKYDAIKSLGWKDYASFRHAMKGKRHYSQGSGYGTSGDKLKRFRGRSSRPDNVVINLAGDATAAVFERNKMRVMLPVLEMAEANPDPKEWSVVKDSLSGVRMASQEEVNSGEAGVDAMVMRELWDARLERPEMSVPIRRGGEQFWVVFTPKNKHIAESLNGVGRDQTAKILGFLQPASRLLGNLYTQWSVTFGISNLRRDAWLGLDSLSLEHGKTARNWVAKNIPNAIKGYWSYQKGGRDSEWAQRVERFRAAGGEAGWMFGGDADTMAKEIETQIRDLNPPRNAKEWSGKKVRALMDVLERYNKSIENGIRLATFTYLTEVKGIPADEAVVYAKELTTNFSMKGKWVAQLGSSFLFLNANLQGNRRNLNLATHGKKGQKVLARKGARKVLKIMAFMAVYDALLYAVSGDDDDGDNMYDKIPEYQKDRTIYWPNPGGAPIPIWTLPYGRNVLFTAGRKISETLMGRKSVAEATLDAAGSLASSFSPVGGVSIDSDEKMAEIGRMVMPSVLDIGVDLVGNVTWTGRNIAPEPMAWDRAPGPAWTRAYDHTPSGYVALSKFLSDITGGTNTRPSNVFDIPPEYMAHVVKSLGGGTLRDVTGFPSAFMSAAEEDWGEMGRNIPVLRGFMPGRTDLNSYWRMKEHAVEVEYAVAEYEDLAARGMDKEADAFAKKHGAILSLAKDLKDLDKLAKSSRAAARAATGELRAEIELNAMDAIQAFNRKAKKARESQ